MKLPISVSGQAQVFLYSVMGGILIAFIYDVFRIKRKAIKTSSIVIYLEDFIYWIIVAVVMFALVYYSNEGEIRGYIFIGTVLGVILYALMFSKIIMKSSLFIIGIICKVFKAVWMVITYPFRIIFKILGIPAGFFLKAFKKAFRGAKRIGRSNLSRVTVWKKMFRNIRKKI